MEDPVLIANNSSLDGQQWLIRSELTLGRDASCDVVIPDRQVSRRHARLANTAQGVIFEDLGSKNGSYLNGKALAGPEKLVEGDEIRIAFTQSFIFLSSDATLPLADLPPELSGAFCLRVDEASKRVWVRGIELDPPLSAQQFALLACLYRNAGEVMGRESLIRAVWEGESAWASEQAFDALVRRLRERLALLDGDYEYIVTVRGHGLRLDNEVH